MAVILGGILSFLVKYLLFKKQVEEKDCRAQVVHEWQCVKHIHHEE